MSLSFIMVFVISFQIFAFGEKNLHGALQVGVEVPCWRPDVETARSSAVGTGAASPSRCQRLSGHCAHDTTLMVTFAQCFEQALNILSKDTLENKMLSFDLNLSLFPPLRTCRTRWNNLTFIGLPENLRQAP